ncbi:cytochrome P450 [Pseudonocardia sp. K10HN5]|uniref:Cytochrome P450 n=2 Tax=Pseudonocardia acidicola TaxID=2724939 RepID=A0ABX1SEJ4_9PSEU|nr:cytochrome P450 [Pseudonocardia acidicola]NMH99329.1 cytochrome P450 [Pseudonocardia acidicola]
MRIGLDPVPELAALRSERPVARLEVPDDLAVVWLVTGHEEVRAVLGDTASFSNDLHNLAGTGLEMLAEQDPGGLGFRDPPEHTRLRRLLTPAFTVRRLRELQPRIEAVVAAQLDAMAAAGPGVDLVETFAVPVPSLVICELLGVPVADRAEFERRSVSRFDALGDMESSLAAVHESMDYLRGLVVAQRSNPGDGLLGMLIREHGDEVGDDDLAALADGVLTGGHETTASMLALGALVLLEDPQRRAAVLGDAAGVDAVVEDLLRYLSVVQVAFPRFARHDVEVGGVRIGAGDVVLCSLSGADRDPALGSAGHLAFGHGLHRCVGAELGRMELRTAYPALLRRFPGLRLAVPRDELAFRMFSIVYGVESLPVEW